jgi:hypothetical protein
MKDILMGLFLIGLAAVANAFGGCQEADEREHYKNNIIDTETGRHGKL